MRSQMVTTSLSWLGKKGFATRRLRQALEHARVPVRIVFVEYTNGVDDGAGLLGQFHDLGQAMRAHVVTAITDDNQHFLIPAARLQHSSSAVAMRVVKSRLAHGGPGRDGGFEFGGAIGKCDAAGQSPTSRSH